MTYAAIYSDQAVFENPQKHSWQDLALCAQTDPEVFFPDKGGTYRPPRRVCGSCVVRSNCLEKAMTEEASAHASDRFGMFGGLTPQERYALYLERNGLEEPESEIAPEIAA